MSLFRKRNASESDESGDSLITAIDNALNKLAFSQQCTIFSGVGLEVGTNPDAVRVLCADVMEDHLLAKLRAYYQPLGYEVTSHPRSTHTRDLKTRSIDIKPLL